MKHKFDLDKIDAIIKDEEINGCSVCEDCKTTYTNYILMGTRNVY